MYLPKKQLFKLVSIMLIAVVVGVIAIVFFNLNRTAIQKELIALDLLPKPEKLTELYFNDSTHLPTSANSQVVSFAFVIHNLETTDYQYVYEISVNVNGTKHIVDRGNVLVKDNQYYAKNEKFNLTHSPGRQEVVVELVNMQQSIDFWVG